MTADVGQFSYRMPFGAELLVPDRTRFRLWAPDAKRVVLVGDLLGEAEMPAAQQAGWYELELPCGAGTEYSYRVTNQAGIALTVPDPAARAQLDSVHGCSLVVDPQAYQWQHADWCGRPWHEAVIYELHVGLLGGYAGVRQRLPALAAMGVTALELMPLASFPGTRNWGYDGVLLFAPQYSYGSPDELKQLVDEAHGLGMMVFLDVVYNHFGPDGNYLHHYCSAFFSDDFVTPWGSAINFHHAEVRNFYTSNVLYWLDEFRFDGLRFDACHAIIDQSWLFEIAQQVAQRYQDCRQVHLMAENDDNFAVLLDGGVEALSGTTRAGSDLAASPLPGSHNASHMIAQGRFAAQWNDDGHHVLHVLLTGETEGYYADYAESPAHRLARCLAEGFIFQGEPSPYRGTDRRGTPSAYLPPTAFVLFLQNHDQVGNRPFGERLTTLAQPAALRAAQALVMLSAQIPMLFMGEEFGATEPFLYFISSADEALLKAVRDGRRREFAGFSKFADAAMALEIPDPGAELTFTTCIPDTQQQLALTNLQWMSQLLALRHQYIIPHLPGAYALGTHALAESAVYASWQLGDGSRLHLYLNLAAQAIPFDAGACASSGQAQPLLLLAVTQMQLAAGELPPYSFSALLEPAA